MIALYIVFLAVILGWIVSGSLVPAASMLVSVAVYYLLVLLRFPLNRLLVAAIILLIMTLQGYAFRNGYAGIIYEDLPWSFHTGMGCFLWAWMISALKDGSRKQVGGWYFSVCLTGSLLLFWAAASVEIFRFSPFLIRSLASIPLVVILWQEYQRCSRYNWTRKIAPALLAIPILGGLCTVSRDSSAYLSSWIKKEDALKYTIEEGDKTSTMSGVGLSAGDGVVELPRRADIAIDNHTRFFLQVQSIENFLALTRRPLYLRTSTVSVFDGNERILPLNEGRWLLDKDDGTRDQITTLPERSPGRYLSYSIVLPKEDAQLIPLVEGTNRIHADEVFHYAESRYQLGLDSDAEWLRFVALGPRDERKYAITPWQNPDPDSPHLNRPETELATRVKNLTIEIVGNNNPEKAISKYIQDHCRYSLKYRNPKNLSPVENLLFGEKKGHCELFASATVMMLRSVGIASRIAYGYTGGTANREQLAIAFRGSDIHAWAEIYDKNGEWRIFDTTPANSGSRRLARTGGDSRIDWRMASFNPAEGMAATGEEVGQQSVLALFFANISDWAASWFFALLGGVIAVAIPARWIFVKWLRKNRNHLGQSLSAPDSDIVYTQNTRPEFIEAILALGESAGIPRPPGRTLKEYIGELQQSGLYSPTIEEAVDYFYNVRYGEKKSDPGIERRFLEAIRASRQ